MFRRYGFGGFAFLPLIDRMFLHMKSIVIFPVLHSIFPMLFPPHCQRGAFLPWLVHPAGVRSRVDDPSDGLKAAWLAEAAAAGLRGAGCRT